jgi:hypothetical protein
MAADGVHWKTRNTHTSDEKSSARKLFGRRTLGWEYRPSIKTTLKLQMRVENNKNSTRTRQMSWQFGYVLETWILKNGENVIFKRQK